MEIPLRHDNRGTNPTYDRISNREQAKLSGKKKIINSLPLDSGKYTPGPQVHDNIPCA